MHGGQRRVLVVGAEARDPGKEHNVFLYELWDLTHSTFTSPGENLLVCFHMMASTWEAPFHLATFHSKEAQLENLIFLTTDAGFQSRGHRHVCSV